jgi:hypothetical protein
MKTKCANLPVKICVLLVVLSFGAKVHGSVIDLVLTEEDGNTLVLTGADASNWTVTGSADHWTATRSAPFPGIAVGTAFASWTEPDNSGEINALEMSYFPGAAMTLSVVSDQLVTTDDSPVSDGTPVLLNFLNANGGPVGYSVRYFDQGDSVPDLGSTAFCLALGMIPLLWLKHRRHAVSR